MRERPSKQVYFSHSRAKVILHLLGLRSILELSRLSGVSPVTLSNLLYKPRESMRSANFRVVLKVAQTLRDRYLERKRGLEPDLRKMAETYINRWIHRVIEHDTRVCGRRWSSCPKQKAQTELRLKRRIEQYHQIAKELEV